MKRYTSIADELIKKRGSITGPYPMFEQEGGKWVKWEDFKKIKSQLIAAYEQNEADTEMFKRQLHRQELEIRKAYQLIVDVYVEGASSWDDDAGKWLKRNEVEGE